VTSEKKPCTVATTVQGFVRGKAQGV